MRRRPLFVPAGGRRRRFGALLPHGFSPFSLGSQLKAWYDPADMSAVRLRGGATLPGSTGTPGTAAECYLETPHAAEFNGGDNAGGYTARTHLTLSFWLRHGGTGALNATNDLNRTIVAKGYNSGFSGGSWGISTGDNFNEEEFLAVYLWTNATTGLVVASTTDQPLAVRGRWYHVVVKIDLTAGTDANRVRVWVDGVQATMSAWSGALPAQLQNSTLPLSIGRRLGNGHNDFGGDVSDVAIWSADVPNPSTLWNSGRGIYHGTNDWIFPGYDQALEAYWPLAESAGNRLDASGNGRHLVPSGTNAANMASVAIVEAARNKADRIWDSVARSGWADWLAAGLGGRPCFVFNSRIVSLVGTVGPRVERLFSVDNEWPGGVANNTGDLVMACRVVDMHTECPLFASTNKDDDDSYLVWMLFRPTNPGTLQWAVRMNADDEGLDANWYGPAGEPAIGTDYVVNWSWGGAAASVAFRQNGVDKTVTYPAGAKPANGDESWSSIAARDNYTVGCWNRSTGVQMAGHSRVGQIVVAGPKLAESLNRKLEAWIAAKQGIAII